MSTPTPPPSPRTPLLLLDPAPQVPGPAPTERAEETADETADKTADLAELFSVASLEATKPEASQEEVRVVRAMVNLIPQSWGLASAKPDHIDELIGLVICSTRRRPVQSRTPVNPLPPPIRRQIAKKDLRIKLLKRGESSVRGGSAAPRLRPSARPLATGMLVPELFLPPAASKRIHVVNEVTLERPDACGLCELCELNLVQEGD